MVQPEIPEDPKLQPDIPELPKPKSTSRTLGLVGILLQLGWWILVLVGLVAPQALNGEDGAFWIFAFSLFSIAGFVLSIVATFTRKGAGRLLGIVGTVLGVLAIVGFIVLVFKPSSL